LVFGSVEQSAIIFVIAGTLAKTRGTNLQTLQNLRGDNGGVEVMNCSPGFLRQRHFVSMPGTIRLMPATTGKVWRCGRESLLIVPTVIPASLPENFPSKVYVIHEMHLASVFFIRHKHGRNNFSFCVIFTQNEASVFRQSPAAETGTVNVIFTTVSLPDFRAKIVQSLHKMTLPLSAGCENRPGMGTSN
jgi:hypothetical protein